MGCNSLRTEQLKALLKAMVQHSNRRGRVVIQMRWVYFLSCAICSDRQGGCKSWRGHSRGPGSAHSERPRRGEAELHQSLDPAQVPASTFCMQQPRKERDWERNQPAAISWNKCILMRGAWQPHGCSMCAHLLLPSPLLPGCLMPPRSVF